MSTHREPSSYLLKRLDKYMSNDTQTNSTIDRYALLKDGVLVDTATDAKALQELIRLLRPRQINHPLIRIGGDADGGYLVPDNLSGISACFSPGVSDLAKFEEELWGRYQIPSHLADYSVNEPPSYLNYKSFEKKFLGSLRSDQFITLDDWVSRHETGPTSFDLILQMDIEGGEYETLLATSINTLKRFRFMVIEFHCAEDYAQRNYFNLVRATFKKLLATFVPVHIHPNNCCGTVNVSGVRFPRVFEMTFSRRDSCVEGDFCSELPHPLDRANLPHLDDLALPNEWIAADQAASG